MTSDKARRYAAELRDGRPIDRDALAADLRALADGIERSGAGVPCRESEIRWPSLP